VNLSLSVKSVARPGASPRLPSARGGRSRPSACT